MNHDFLNYTPLSNFFFRKDFKIRWNFELKITCLRTALTPIMSFSNLYSLRTRSFITAVKKDIVCWKAFWEMLHAEFFIRKSYSRHSIALIIRILMIMYILTIHKYNKQYIFKCLFFAIISKQHSPLGANHWQVYIC